MKFRVGIKMNAFIKKIFLSTISGSNCDINKEIIKESISTCGHRSTWTLRKICCGKRILRGIYNVDIENI